MFKTNCAYADADCAARGGAGRETAEEKRWSSVRISVKGRGANLDSQTRICDQCELIGEELPIFDIIKDALRNFSETVILIQ